MSWLKALEGTSWLLEPSKSKTYRYRDPQKRREQMREVMRKRRQRTKDVA